MQLHTRSDGLLAILRREPTRRRTSESCRWLRQSGPYRRVHPATWSDRATQLPRTACHSVDIDCARAIRPMSASHMCAEIRFFFQAEDGIRDLTVTGVQTCALPI